jgi:hypothetical protein
MLQGNRQKMPEICGDTVGFRPWGFPCFLLTGDPVKNVPIRSPLLFEHFPKCIRYSVSIAERSSILFEESPIPFRYCSSGLPELLGAFPDIDLGISFTFPSKQLVSVY